MGTDRLIRETRSSQGLSPEHPTVDGPVQEEDPAEAAEVGP